MRITRLRSPTSADARSDRDVRGRDRSLNGRERGRRGRGRGRYRTAILVFVWALWAAAASAETQALRCGNKLISPGDSAAKLREYCGEPESVHTRLEQRGLFVHGRHLPGFAQEVAVEEWTYNFGPNKLMRQVQVVDGIVSEIKVLGYGYLDVSP